MNKFRTLILTLLMVAFAIGAGADMSAAQLKPDTSCPRYEVAQKFKQAVVANQGEIEPIHIPEGLAIFATAKTVEQVTAIQTAAKQYLAANRMLVPDNKSTPCWVALRAIKEGMITENVTPTEKGVLITLITRDARLREVLQQGNCCQYCICPSTVTRCAGCC